MKTNHYRCANKNCILKHRCYRWKLHETESGRAMYVVTKPKDGKCDMFIDDKSMGMWTTSFKHSETGVEEMTHYFDQNVRIVTNLPEQTIKRYHGDVCVKEYTLDPQVVFYLRFLENVAEEINLVIKN